MIWAQTILPLFLGLIGVGPFQIVHAENEFFNLRVRNSTHNHRPGNKTHHYSAVTPAIVDNALYMKYACQGKQNGLRLPIEGSCTQYLECQRGSTKLMACKNGKHFSTFGLTCIDARLSNCSVKCECCGKRNGLYPDKTSCSSFIVCEKEKAHRQSCGSVLKFNPKKLMCDIPQRAKCSEMSNSTLIERKIGSKTPLYLVSHKVCLNRSNSHTVGVQGSCNKFYLCVNGIGYLKSCGNMQFNNATHYCDTRTRVFCPQFEDDFVILDSDEVTKPSLRPDVPVVDVPKHPGSYEELQPPHRVPGMPFPQEQHPGQFGSRPPTVGKPQHPHWTHRPAQVPQLPEGPQAVPKPPVLVGEPIPVPPTIVVPDVEEVIDPKEYAGLCADQAVGALLPLPKHCTKYIRCKWDWYERRVAEVLSCPKGEHFNAKSKLCDKPKKAGCRLH